MSRPTIFPLLLIVGVADWAFKATSEPHQDPDWLHWSFNAAFFVFVATHIWRGRAWR